MSDPAPPPDDPHFALEPLELPGGGRAVTKPGVRGYPDAAEGVAPLLPFAADALRRAEGAGAPLVDLSGGAGAPLAALHARAEGAGEDGASEGGAGEGAPAGAALRVLEPSAAALRCARAALPAARVRAGLPWDLAGAAGALLLAPPAERGNARVEAELAGAARALARGDDAEGGAAGGAAWIALHKDRGGKRYARRAEAFFERVEVVERSRGWRVLRASGARPAAADAPAWGAFELRLPGGAATVRALPGVHAAGRLDPGSAELLARLPAAALAGRRVLDLGCGSGVLALFAAAAGASATAALDDDLAAVRSAARNAAEAGLALDALHSDLDAELAPDARFETVLCNPPFHVGRGVRLELPRAFVRAARRRLERGGELWLVANAQLPYEREFGDWADLAVTDAGRFKVLRARR